MDVFKKVEDYLKNGSRIVKHVEPTDDFTLVLLFDNGEKRLYDMHETLKKGGVFETFRKLDRFKEVYIDDDDCIAWDIDKSIDSNIHWNNHVSIDSDSCYLDSVSIKE